MLEAPDTKFRALVSTFYYLAAKLNHPIGVLKGMSMFYGVGVRYRCDKLDIIKETHKYVLLFI